MPKFPFKRSVADDLRDLWAIDRIDRQARTLGYSSISPGDGSLDLINASGATIARYGDLPGGGFGIGVPDGSGGWRTVQEDAQARADGAVAPLASEVTTARGGFATLNARLSDHASRLGSTEGRLDSHASRIGGVENRATTAEGRLDSHASRLGSAEGRLDSHASRIGATEGDISDAEAQIDYWRGNVNILRAWCQDLYNAWRGQGTDPGNPPWWT